MNADAASLSFAAPALLVVPAGVVHGFDWRSESTGWVLTLATAHVGGVRSRHPDLAPVFASATAVAMDAAELATAEASMEALARELGWAAPGHRAAVDGALLSLLVVALRGRSPESGSGGGTSRRAAEIVARFRARLEERYRLREPMSAYASALGLSEARLRAACSRIAGRPPAAMLDDRSLLEAQRALSYTNLSVAEIGYALGFVDPAYFSRFFARHAGRSPRDYRLRPATVPIED